MGSDKRGNSPTPPISTWEKLIINLPAAGFICLAGLCLGLGLILQGVLRVLLLLGCWWNLCGSVMLLIDYRNKRSRYLSLIRGTKISPGLAAKLKETICGACLYLSYLYRKRKTLKHSGHFSRDVPISR